jgi:uncharacterized membrane protein YgaE (UPF0421/DUF939 family)
MRVESAEASERQRQQAALEQQRLQQEMELRRAEVAKKRPTWMLAVTGLAMIGIVAALIFTVHLFRSSADDRAAKEKAEQIAKQAVQDAKEAQDKVEKLSSDLADLDKKVNSAVDGVMAAQNDADRNAARSNLEKLRHEKFEMEQRIQAAKTAAAKAERAKGVHLSKECLENPLAKGCN